MRRAAIRVPRAARQTMLGWCQPKRSRSPQPDLRFCRSPPASCGTKTGAPTLPPVSRSLPWRICCGFAMHITDLTHFLDKSGAIGPVKGPARTMAQFNVDAVAHASDSTSETLPAPKCFKCKKGVVEAVLAQDNAVVWVCPKCRIEGRISNWQGSLWDLRNRPPTSG